MALMRAHRFFSGEQAVFGAAEGAGGEFGERGSPRGESRIVLVDEEPIGVVARELETCKAKGLQTLNHLDDDSRRGDAAKVMKFDGDLRNASEDIGRRVQKERDFCSFNVDLQKVHVADIGLLQKAGECSALDLHYARSSGQKSARGENSGRFQLLGNIERYWTIMTADRTVKNGEIGWADEGFG